MDRPGSASRAWALWCRSRRTRSQLAKIGGHAAVGWPASRGPERAWSYEAGFKQQIGRGLALDGALFLNDYRGLIEGRPDIRASAGVPVARFQNLSRARVRGFEGEALLALPLLVYGGFLVLVMPVLDDRFLLPLVPAVVLRVLPAAQSWPQQPPTRRRTCPFVMRQPLDV